MTRLELTARLNETLKRIDSVLEPFSPGKGWFGFDPNDYDEEETITRGDLEALHAAHCLLTTTLRDLKKGDE
jgi:hypothetical protein